MRGALYTLVIIRVNIILNHVDLGPILPGYESSCTSYDSNGARNAHKNYKILIS